MHRKTWVCIIHGSTLYTEKYDIYQPRLLLQYSHKLWLTIYLYHDLHGDNCSHTKMTMLNVGFDKHIVKTSCKCVVFLKGFLSYHHLCQYFKTFTHFTNAFEHVSSVSCRYSRYISFQKNFIMENFKHTPEQEKTV